MHPQLEPCTLSLCVVGQCGRVGLAGKVGIVGEGGTVEMGSVSSRGALRRGLIGRKWRSWNGSETCVGNRVSGMMLDTLYTSSGLYDSAMEFVIGVGALLFWNLGIGPPVSIILLKLFMARRIWRFSSLIALLTL